MTYVVNKLSGWVSKLNGILVKSMVMYLYIYLFIVTETHDAET